MLRPLKAERFQEPCLQMGAVAVLKDEVDARNYRKQAGQPQHSIGMANESSYVAPTQQAVNTPDGLTNPKSVASPAGLNYEAARLDTFAGWPFSSPVDGSRLAKAGFYYDGNGDEVICFSCKGRIGGWTFGDSPFEKHKTLFPECDFVNGRSNNVHLPNFMPRKASRALPQMNGVTHPKAKAPLVNGHVHDDVAMQTENNHINGVNKVSNVTNQRGAGAVANGSGPLNGFKMDANDMTNEVNRRRTFDGKWRVSYIDPDELASAGFYYVGPDDKVKCAFCYGCLFSWQPGDRPFVVHVSKFPFCPLVLGREKGVTRRGVELMQAGVPVRGYDVCGVYEHHSVPENGFKQYGPEIEKLGIQLHRGPEHKEQASLAARLRTFESWPSNIPVKPEQLAEAGFYYIGVCDNTKCFYCDGGLHDWKLGDDPWREHARWFPHCGFVRLNRSEEFIRECSQEAAAQNGSISPSELKKLAKATTVNNSKFSVTGLQRHATFPPGRHATPTSVFPDITVNSLANGPRRGSCIESRNLERGREFLKESSTSKGVMMENEPLTTNSEGRFLCKICLDREVGVVFLPCGHLLACTQCAAGLRDCPVCRQVIQGTVRTFFS